MEAMIKRLPTTGGIKEATKSATDLPFGFLDLNETIAQKLRTKINTTKIIENAILIIAFI